MRVRRSELERITKVTASVFLTFGGGSVSTWGNPLSEALKDKPPMFAAGVDVAQVVSFVLDCYKPPKPKKKQPRPRTRRG